MIVLALVAWLGAPVVTANFQKANFQTRGTPNFQTPNFQTPNCQTANFQTANVQTGNVQTANFQTSNSQTAKLNLRFHHLHLKVADPAAAMNALAQKVGGTRVILQGLGVGVRSGDHYVLFDRMTPDDPQAAAGPSDMTARYGRIVALLAARGAVVTPSNLPAAVVVDPLAGESLGHIAFTTDDFDGTVERLVKAGISPVHRTGDAVRFAIDGDHVELVRDTERPDAFWCPMHLDVRSPDRGKCPVCGMDLVAIPPLRLGEYQLDVDVRPRELTLKIADPDGAPVEEFVTVHERPFHLFIISRDLEQFLHVHPDARTGAAGVWQWKMDPRALLKPGGYMAIADVLPYGGTSQMLHRAFVTPGYKGSIFRDAPKLAPGPTEVVVDGIRVRIEADLAARKEGTVRFTFADAATGAPITDLEPFLGAPAHMLIVNPDLTDAIHGHPEEKETGGPVVTFEPLMPAPAVYKLWVQFQRKGRLFTAPFVVRVT